MYLVIFQDVSWEEGKEEYSYYPCRSPIDISDQQMGSARVSVFSPIENSLHGSGRRVPIFFISKVEGSESNANVEYSKEKDVSYKHNKTAEYEFRYKMFPFRSLKISPHTTNRIASVVQDIRPRLAALGPVI